MIFTSCEVIKSDPTLKESERIGVLEKAKTDTLNIYIEMDKKVYVVRENNIVNLYRVCYTMC